ncbi:Acetamidase [Microdochium trichocladiopsis]|uniref:amidase n=1 Tax=Microdochium trichocladiopsis TaxID=1682393 RepID=A0A9P8Y707_9PEZI|nr:Acetamidase [Microdochium trichocladiopsis]KAH7029548.1 Acetamidase [Microdochium trichocladiopsis]
MGDNTGSTPSWEDLARDKRERLAAKIPTEWRLKELPTTDSVIDFPRASGLLSATEIGITETSASSLVADLAAGRLKSVNVVLAFCKRAAIAQQLTNCMLEFDTEMALARAKVLDEYHAQHGKPVGPLHGLPVSLKDQLHVKGLETSMGYIAWLGKPATKESVLTTLLRQAGAVFYTKTSVPQTLMVGETFNNIVGLTTNPRNKNWSPGGSSGGEGALLALRGSCLGVGTDIGGSIRIPAAFNSLYGIRPCHGRLPYAGMANSMAGQETIPSVVGPLGHSAADLRLFMKAVLAQKPWLYDSKTVPLPWRQEIEDETLVKIKTKTLNIGFYETDGMALPHPPILRAIKEAVEKLKQAGHNVVPWTPYKHDVPYYLLKELDKADAGADLHRDISASGEPAIDLIKNYVYRHTKQLGNNEVWDLQTQKWRYQTEYLDQWREFEATTLGPGAELDAIIAPVAPTAAVRHGKYRYYGYTGVLNMLDFTSVVVPVGFADKDRDVPNTGYVPVSELDSDVQAEYDPEAYHGAPTAVQVIGRRLSEEKTLAIAEELGRLLHSQKTGPSVRAL